MRSRDEVARDSHCNSTTCREEQLHNPQHLDPASSTPWRFKQHMHALHFAAATNNLHALSALLARWPSHVNAKYASSRVDGGQSSADKTGSYRAVQRRLVQSSAKGAYSYKHI